MEVKQGYSGYNPSLCEFTNHSIYPRYLLYLCMGGSGFNIVKVASGDTWREGVGEEYMGDYGSYEEAEAGCHAYIANQAYEIIQRDGFLSEEEKADLKEVVSELIKKSQKQAKEEKFRQLMNKVTKTTAELLRELLMEVLKEGIKRLF